MSPRKCHSISYPCAHPTSSSYIQWNPGACPVIVEIQINCTFRFHPIHIHLTVPQQQPPGYAPQGQYSPEGLEAIWPIYRDQPVTLPTGLAQAAYTNFLKLPIAHISWKDLTSMIPFLPSLRQMKQTQVLQQNRLLILHDPY